MNMLLVVLMFVGVVSLVMMCCEVFFEFEFDIVFVSVLYLGVSFEEVEEGIC